MLKIGMIVDNRYKILREIGRGGTSCVYLAENIRVHNYWAIKEVYKNSITENSTKSNTLIAESSILTKLHHPGLPTIIDVIDTSQSYLIVMEYIEGISLDKALKKMGIPSERNVIKWGQQICNVLEYLHSQQPPIIYRDMKPANIMLKPDGNLVLIDFGLAREFKVKNCRDTTKLGTYGYAAPEQYDGSSQSDARTDIYGLGVTLYHLVTGQDPCLPPYGINSICSIDPNLSHQLDQIIQKCTRLQPEQRYQTANELNRALRNIDLSGRVETDIDTEQSRKSNKWIWALAFIPIVIIALIAMIAVIISNPKNTVDRKFDIAENVTGFIKDIFDDSDDVTLYFEQKVYINEPDERENYPFIPEKTGYYDIYSQSGAVVPVVWLSDEDDTLIAEDNTYGEYTEFVLHCWLEEGQTYYIQTTLYDLDPNVSATGSYWIYVEYSD